MFGQYKVEEVPLGRSIMFNSQQEIVGDGSLIPIDHDKNSM